MKLIIAGSRNLNPNKDLINGLICFFGLDTEVHEVVSGAATGVDKAGEIWASEMLNICNTVILTQFPADWNTYGKSAGPRRNKKMAEHADALLLIWDGKSRGSKSMKENMEKLGKPVYEVILK